MVEVLTSEVLQEKVPKLWSEFLQNNEMPKLVWKRKNREMIRSDTFKVSLFYKNLPKFIDNKKKMLYNNTRLKIKERLN